jgi:hypothetical protein
VTSGSSLRVRIAADWLRVTLGIIQKVIEENHGALVREYENRTHCRPPCIKLASYLNDRGAFISTPNILNPLMEFTFLPN